MNGVKVEQWKTRKIVKDVWRLTPAHNAPAYLAYQCYYTKPRAILADMIYAMAGPKSNNKQSNVGFATMLIGDRPLIKHRQTYNEVDDVANGSYD